jgi:hypothetical protein
MAKLKNFGIALLIIGLLALQGWFMGARWPWQPAPTLTLERAGHPALVVQPTIVVGTNRQQPIQARPTFQTGIIFPQWGATAYGPQDTDWQTGLNEIAPQIAARWIALTIPFEQDSPSATSVQTSPLTPSPTAVAAGIQLARASGYHIFVQPLLTINGSQSWAGTIQFARQQQAQQWFDSYWHTYQPYVAAASQAGADELAIGTEFAGLEQHWKKQWEQLISRIHAIFPGMLTYDMNWTSMTSNLPSWMQNASLTAIGVSVYIPLTDKAQRVPPKDIAPLWGAKIGQPLDALAQTLHKPVLISNIGYRDSSDTLYQPWQAQASGTNAVPDEQEQAAAYGAALQYALTDTVLEGIFFWAWSQPPYAPNGHAAAQELYKWYSSPQA